MSSDIITCAANTTTGTVKESDLIIENGSRRIFGRLYLPENGEPSASVILSHGYNGSHVDFARECRALAGAGYLACAFDFCGGSAAGKSTGLKTTEMTLFTEKEDLLAVAEAISSRKEAAGKKLFLLGGSQGGFVTALAAEELKERVSEVVLYYPAFIIPENWRDNYKTAEEIPEVTDFWGMKLGKNFFLSIRDFYTFDEIGSYSGPMLILYGDQDPIVPMRAMEQAVKTYPDARLVVLPGEGHGFSPEGTETVIREILDFLARAEGGMTN